MKERNLPFGIEARKMIHEIFRVFKKRIVEQAEIKISIEEFRLLYTINKKEADVIQSDLAYILKKDKSFILRLTDSLEGKGLVKRVVYAYDRRKNYLMVTEKGEKVIKTYVEIGFELMTELQQGLTESDIHTFYKVVNQVRRNSEKL